MVTLEKMPNLVWCEIFDNFRYDTEQAWETKCDVGDYVVVGNVARIDYSIPYRAMVRIKEGETFIDRTYLNWFLSFEEARVAVENAMSSDYDFFHPELGGVVIKFEEQQNEADD